MKSPNLPGRNLGHAYGGTQAYAQKDSAYFANARVAYVSELPYNPRAKILEIGCGRGETGALALAEGKCQCYCGVELAENAAHQAEERITEVVAGNVEQCDFPWAGDTFDDLILSEVLEHLADPWATLRRLFVLLKRGAVVFASSPNVSHWRFIAMLLEGEWQFDDFGPRDRTHLRWFTPRSYRSMFESCGYTVDSIRPVTPLSPKARFASALSFNHLEHLFVRQIDLRAHRPT
ncbi:MAG TPA: class I SAM-dependent methyltransferase [Candidatus Cybelea sp.]|nr:class I SAM-dependent methyltransferase [Candidatus Cybelea sp.]